MLAKQYSHRLPADYDMNIIRQRAIARGPLWDDIQGLAFKAFVVQTKGEHGAVGNLYASVYLWHDSQAAVELIMGERFQGVIDSFGRPAIESWLPLDARAGQAKQALTLYREELPIAENADRQALLQAEVERNQMIARQEDTVAVVTAIDLATWCLIRLRVSSEKPSSVHAGVAYEVLHLARPGLDQLGR
ncbi:DUF4865 family protein [Pseudomonas sp. NA-150]|uniref:DUF4865 family protein n=1 Tax=Pseudomonas sp. NA-150 TaxID=3367525 RepID=UPI0037C9087E